MQVFNDLQLSQESMLSLVALQECLSFTTVQNEEMITLREAHIDEDIAEVYLYDSENLKRNKLI